MLHKGTHKESKINSARQVLQNGSAMTQTGLASTLGQDVFHLSSLKSVCVGRWIQPSLLVGPQLHSVLGLANWCKRDGGWAWETRILVRLPLIEKKPASHHMLLSAQVAAVLGVVTQLRRLLLQASEHVFFTGSALLWNLVADQDIKMFIMVFWRESTTVPCE